MTNSPNVLEKLHEFLVEKRWGVYFIAFIILLVFYKPLIAWYHTNIVLAYLSHVAKGTPTDIVMLLLLLLFFAHFLYRATIRYVPSIHWLVISLFVIIVYGGLRCSLIEVPWIPFAFSCCSSCYYADLLGVYALFNLGYYFKPSWFEKIALLINDLTDSKKEDRKEDEQKEDKLKGFVVDEPVGFGSKPIVDELGYTSYAMEIAQKLMETENKTAFAVGINGSWGSGKTSFAILMKQELPKDNTVVIIDFEPWRSQTSTAIVPDFLEHFKEEIGRYHSGLGSKLNAYARKLAGVDDTLSKLMEYLDSLFLGGGSQQELFDDINTAIGELNRKIFIFIDDIDRLDPSEILEVLRLVRNAASFQHTFFVLTYDKPYVVNALKEGKIYNESAYMEKIVQLEVNLPIYKQNKLYVDNILPEITKIINNKAVVTYFNVHNKRINSNIENALSSSIDTPRTATRFINVFRLDGLVIIEKGGRLCSEFILGEFLVMCLIKAKYPIVHQYLYKSRKLIFNFISSFDGFTQLGLKLSNGSEKSEIENLLLQRKELLLVENEVIEIVALIKSLYGSNVFDSMSMVNSLKFELYYSSILSDSYFSEGYFNSIIASELESLENRLEKIEESKYLAFHHRLYGFDGYGFEYLQKLLLGAFWLSTKYYHGISSSWLISKDASRLAHLIEGYFEDIRNNQGELDEEFSNRVKKDIEQLNRVVLHSLEKFKVSDYLKCEFLIIVFEMNLPNSTIKELFSFASSYFISFAMRESFVAKYTIYDYSKKIKNEHIKNSVSYLSSEVLCEIFKNGKFAMEYVFAVMIDNLANKTRSDNNPFLGLFFDTAEEFESIYLNNEVVNQTELKSFLNFYLFFKDRGFVIKDELIASDTKLIDFWNEYTRRYNEFEGNGDDFIDVIKRGV